MPDRGELILELREGKVQIVAGVIFVCLFCFIFIGFFALGFTRNYFGAAAIALPMPIFIIVRTVKDMKDGYFLRYYDRQLEWKSFFGHYVVEFIDVEYCSWSEGSYVLELKNGDRVRPPVFFHVYDPIYNRLKSDGKVLFK